MKLEKINNISKIETIDNCILYYIDVILSYFILIFIIL